MESHGGLKDTIRQTEQTKKTTHSMQHGPLSARGELQSHPLAGQAQACGHPTQVDGRGARWHLSWPLADTTAQKKLDYISRFVHVILAPVHAILLCIVQARNSSNFVSSSLRRGLALQCAC